MQLPVSHKILNQDKYAEGKKVELTLLGSF